MTSEEVTAIVTELTRVLSMNASRAEVWALVARAYGPESPVTPALEAWIGPAPWKESHAVQ